MNAVIQSMKKRRAIRKYLPKQISDEDLKAILEAGTYAPTGHGWQDPVIVVVQDPETIAQLERLNAAAMGAPGEKPFYGAPTVLVVLADRNRPTYLYDGSLVMGNLLLAAHAIGLGSCWIHRAKEVFAGDEGKALLKKWGVEGDYEGIGHCILGYADEMPEPAPRKENYVIYAK